MATRKKIPTRIETAVLAKSKRRCCLCFYLDEDTKEKPGQIAHLDHNRSNHAEDNLVWLCLKHHDHFDSKTSQAKGYTIDEVKHYRNRMYLALVDFGINAKGEKTSLAKSERAEAQEDGIAKALRTLPRRAMIALATRCARRIRPLLYDLPPNHPDKRTHLAALEKAILVAEDFAQGTLTEGAWEPVDSVNRPLVVANANSAYHALTNFEPAGTAAAAVFQTAIAAWTAQIQDAEDSVSRTLSAVSTADAASIRAVKRMVHSVASPSPPVLIAAASHDLPTLLGLGLGDFPNLGEKIDPSPNGPLGSLWPDREPDWYQQALEKMRDEP